MYLNPTTGNMTMLYHLNSQKGILQLFDATGRLLDSYELDGYKNKLEFDIADLCCGIFEYRLLDDQTLTGFGKIVILR